MAFTPPAAPSVQPGQPPLQPGQQTALAAALSRVSPAPNPKTQTMRTNPQYQWLGKLHSIRKAIDETIQESLDDQPPDAQTLVVAMRHAIDRLINGVQPANASLQLAAEVTETLAPPLSMQLSAQLDQLTRPPSALGAPQITGMPMPGGPPIGGAPPGQPPGAAPPMQPPLPGVQ